MHLLDRRSQHSITVVAEESGATVGPTLHRGKRSRQAAADKQLGEEKGVSHGDCLRFQVEERCCAVRAERIIRGHFTRTGGCVKAVSGAFLRTTMVACFAWSFLVAEFARVQLVCQLNSCEFSYERRKRR